MERRPDMFRVLPLNGVPNQGLRALRIRKDLQAPARLIQSQFAQNVDVIFRLARCVTARDVLSFKAGVHNSFDTIGSPRHSSATEMEVPCLGSTVINMSRPRGVTHADDPRQFAWCLTRVPEADRRRGLDVCE